MRKKEALKKLDQIRQVVGSDERPTGITRVGLVWENSHDGETREDGWSIREVPKVLVSDSDLGPREAAYAIEMVQYVDDDGNVLNTPVTARLTLRTS